MTTANPLLLLLLFLFLKGKKARPRPPMVVHPSIPPPFVPPPTLVHTAAPPAWPSSVPPGLPPFPGPGWVPDSPPGPGVVARAFQYLPILWGRGAGATATEQTAGRWITYRAVLLGPKRSVVAYRLAAATVLPPTIHPATAPPVAVPVSTNAPPVVHVSTAAPAPAAGRLPTLRLTHPNTKGPTVIHLQQRLGIPADGTFGSGTDAAVRTFQRNHGLTPDGIVGPATWAVLG